MRPLQKIIERLNISGKISQSFYGEDIMLWRYFKEKGIRNGFFIDVGAYHPKFYNNTWRLRKKLGFRGINIEPSGRIKLFRKYRKNDINLMNLVGDKNCMARLNYVYEEPALSGKDQSKMVKKTAMSFLVEQKTLTTIIKENNVTKIDLLDIDIEGTEMEVLRGYDWSIMPRLILIENDKDIGGEIDDFLSGSNNSQVSYKLIANTLNNALYEL